MQKISTYWLLVAAYCFLSLGFALSLSLVIRRLPDIGQPRENTQVWVYSGHPVSQMIAPQSNGLNVVTVYLKNVSLRNQDSFLFELSDLSGVIRSIQITGYNIGDGDNVRFQFDPVLDSAGKIYTLTLTSNSPRDIAIGAGYSDPAKSIAYQTYYYPTDRKLVLIKTSQNFIRSLLNVRFWVTLSVIGLLSYSVFLLMPFKLSTFNTPSEKSSST